MHLFFLRILLWSIFVIPYLLMAVEHGPLAGDDDLTLQRMKSLQASIQKAYSSTNLPSFFLIYAWEEQDPLSDYCAKMAEHLNKLGISVITAAHHNQFENIHQFFHKYTSPATLRQHPGHYVVLACSQEMMRKYCSDQEQTPLIVDEVNYFIALRRQKSLQSQAILIKLDEGDAIDSVFHTKFSDVPYIDFTFNHMRAPLDSDAYYEAVKRLCLYRANICVAPPLSSIGTQQVEQDDEHEGILSKQYEQYVKAQRQIARQAQSALDSLARVAEATRNLHLPDMQPMQEHQRLAKAVAIRRQKAAEMREQEQS